MDRPLRVVLLGTSGNGKSATGNTMLGKKIFESQLSPSSVTKECQSGQNSQLMVVDTPGFYGTRDEAYEQDIGRCIVLSSPGPHLFVYVLTPGRFTECDQKVVASIKDKFGSSVVNFMMILFVRKDEIDAKTSREEFIANSPVALKDLIRECGGRYAFVENEPKQDDKDQALVDFIRCASKNGESYYTNTMYDQAMAYVVEVEEAMKKQLANEKDEQRRAIKSDLIGMAARKAVAATVIVAAGITVIGAATIVGPIAAAAAAAIDTVGVAVSAWVATETVVVTGSAWVAAAATNAAPAVVAGIRLAVTRFI